MKLGRNMLRKMILEEIRRPLNETGWSTMQSDPEIVQASSDLRASINKFLQLVMIETEENYGSDVADTIREDVLTDAFRHIERLLDEVSHAGEF